MSTLAKIDFLRSNADVFYDVRMTSTDTDAVGTDAILRHIDAEADSVSIEVTLYLPWGVATGITVSSDYFGHYVANFFAKNDAHDVAGRLGTLEAEQARVFLHLRKARCYVAGTVVEHDSLRVRLADVSAWTVAGITEQSAGPPLAR
jgi:hypothetical protein